jgi:hypothetical protein
MHNRDDDPARKMVANARRSFKSGLDIADRAMSRLHVAIIEVSSKSPLSRLSIHPVALPLFYPIACTGPSVDPYARD